MIARLESRVSYLTDRVQELEAQLKKDSSNSSKPPSSDPPWKPPAQRRQKGRPRGGQPGHAGRERTEVPPDEVVVLKPPSCQHCGAELTGDDPSPWRHQVTDIPEVVARTTEFQLHLLQCHHCQQHTRAAWPEGVPQGAFGPRLQAIIAVCSGAYRLSKRSIEELLADFFKVRVSLGSIANIEQGISTLLAPPVDEAAERVRRSLVVHADETGWTQAHKRAWLWVAATAKVVVFMIRRLRSAAVAQELLGRCFAGVLVADQFLGYRWVKLARRQLCWAHLVRHFRALLDYGVEAQAFGERLLALTEGLFAQWHRIRDGTLPRAQFPELAAPFQADFGALLREGTGSSHRRVRTLCTGLLRDESALWTFVTRRGVEPTNNAAERALRHAVVWRKTSFGTDSEGGSRFVERMLTVVATLRCQGRNVLEYVTAACQAGLLGRAAPSLLPERA